ncbi:MAG: hypothetical protein KDC83_09935 [Flavobacteriales bacterium]|nr:hypothetical protein [Flavobacteriales bacterium]
MKKVILSLFLGLIIGGQGFSQSSDYCPKTEPVIKCRKALVPYKYTNMVVKRITYKRFNYIEEISIPLYYDARYRFVFNTELLPNDLKIEIYDKPQGEKKREKLFEANSSEKNFNFEPEPGSGLYSVYVDFLIPAYIDENGGSFAKGCVILMTGFEDEVSKAFESSGDASTSGTK